MKNRFEIVKIKDIGTVLTGNTPKTSIASNFGNDYMFIGPTDLHQHFFIKKSEKMISEKGLQSIKSSTLEGTSILVGCIGWGMGNVGIVNGKCATNQQINSITKINDKYNPLYIYYWLKTKKDFLFKSASVTRTPILNKSKFSNIDVIVPKSRKEQDIIVDFLTSVDKKIEVNNLIKSELEKISKTLYEYWFVHFNFPDFNSLPYKVSGGKMEYNGILKKDIPIDWEVVSISKILEIKTGKEDASFASDDGKFHFFTCAENHQYCNEYAFEGKAILLAGNGSFSVKMYNGKFNAYQRTYVLIPSDDRLFAPLYFLVKDHVKTLVSGSRGSIIKFITKGDIEDIYLPIPKNRDLSFTKNLTLNFDLYSKLYEQNLELVRMKNWLLPMLMNGQISIRDAEEHIAKTFEQNG